MTRSAAASRVVFLEKRLNRPRNLPHIENIRNAVNCMLLALPHHQKMTDAVMEMGRCSS